MTVAHKNTPMGNVFWNYLCWKKALMGDLRVSLVRGFVPVCSKM